MHLGDARAKLLDVILALTSTGMPMTQAVQEVQSVCRATIYRYLRAVRGRPRDVWPDVLLSARLKATPDNDRGRVWQAMRIRRKFTMADLEAIAETSGRNIRNFVWALDRAGFVRSEGKAAPYRPVVWTLVRNPGPRAPRILRDGSVYDPNRKEAFPCKPVTRPNNANRRSEVHS